MDRFNPAIPQIAGSMVVLALAFVLREITSGVSREAGQELWEWLRQLGDP